MKWLQVLMCVTVLPWMLAAKQLPSSLESPPVPTEIPGTNVDPVPANSIPDDHLDAPPEIVPGANLEAPPEPVTEVVPEGTGLPGVDHTNPVAVVETVFEAARTGQFALLANLCDPMGEAEGDVQRICSVATNAELQAEFVEWFQAGRVNGEAIIAGSEAQVPILFGAAGDQGEVMILVLRDAGWYLMGI